MTFSLRFHYLVQNVHNCQGQNLFQLHFGAFNLLILQHKIWTKKITIWEIEVAKFQKNFDSDSNSDWLKNK